MTLLLIALVVAGTPSPPPDATDTRRGLVNTTTQSFGGRKTFTDGGIIAESLTVGDGGLTTQRLVVGDGGIVSSGDLIVGGNLVVDGGFALNGAAFLTTTTSTMTLYVDPTGNNANACTSTGADACLTVDGALAKVPTYLKHNVTINVAAGTYGPFTVNDFITSGGVSLTIQGAPLVNVTSVPSGNVTGTVTSYSAGTFPTKGVLRDTASSWPARWSVNDRYVMRGAFLSITGGTGSGQTRVVTESSPTELNLVSNYTTAPVAGSTYAIQEPATVFTSSSSTIATIGRMSGQLNLNNLKFLMTAGTAASLVVTASRPNAGLRLSTSFCLFYDQATSAGSTITIGAQDATVVMVDTVIKGGNNTVGISYTGNFGNLSLTRSYIDGQRGAVSIGGATVGQFSTTQLSTRNITQSSVVSTGVGRLSFSTAYIVCEPRPEEGTYYGGMIGVQSSFRGGTITGFNFSIDGCGIGVFLRGGYFSALGGSIEMKNINASYYLSNGTAYYVINKGFVDLSASTLSYSNVSGDGGVTYILGGQEVNDSTLAAMPDGGQFVENFQGIIFRR